MSFTLLTDVLGYLVQHYRGTLIYVVGDFNTPVIDWMTGVVKKIRGKKALHQYSMNCFEEFGFPLLVTELTHIKGNTFDLVCKFCVSWSK